MITRTGITRIHFDSSWIELVPSCGPLRVFGQGALNALGRQSMAAIRVRYHQCSISTSLTFKPENIFQAAGLVMFYDINNYYYLAVTLSKQLNPILQLIQSDLGRLRIIAEVNLKNFDKYYLKANLDNTSLMFFYRNQGEDQWLQVGGVLDSTILSDDYAEGFTGMMAGLAVQDVSGQGGYADFHNFNMGPM